MLRRVQTYRLDVTHSKLTAIADGVRLVNPSLVTQIFKGLPPEVENRYGSYSAIALADGMPLIHMKGTPDEVATELGVDVQ